MIFHS